MPPPINPPPTNEGGAITNPRMLNRWLDINPVFPLKRTELFFTIPSFSAESDWKGYSEIVAVYNYTASKNFSLLDFDIPLSPNYIACVTWVDSEYNVYRYKLWENVGEVIYFDVPLYNGELIKRNFRIEIWSVAPESFLSFNLNGAGDAAVNAVTFTYVSNSSWTTTPFTYAAALASGPSWRIVRADASIRYRSDVVDTFPFLPWFTVNGAAPAPFASVPITVSQAATLTFYTTVKGGYDYIWQDDTAVASPSTIVTNFQWPLDAGVFPLPFLWPVNSYPTLN